MRIILPTLLLAAGVSGFGQTSIETAQPGTDKVRFFASLVNTNPYTNHVVPPLKLGDTISRIQNVALVVGMDRYAEAPPLDSAGRDAGKMASLLRNLDFQVQLASNPGRAPLSAAFSQFVQQTEPGGVAIFYYAGHGFRSGNVNYLLPSDARPVSEQSAVSSSLSLDAILDQLRNSKAAANLVILDSCLSDPFTNTGFQWKPLANVAVPPNTYLAIAASPGQKAFDNADAGEGIFTQELTKALRERNGQTVQQTFEAVREQVALVTGGRQIPWLKSTLPPDFALDRVNIRVNTITALDRSLESSIAYHAWSDALGYWRQKWAEVEAGDRFECSGSASDAAVTTVSIRDTEVSIPRSDCMDAAARFLRAGEKRVYFAMLEMPRSKYLEVEQMVADLTGQPGDEFSPISSSAVRWAAATCFDEPPMTVAAYTQKMPEEASTAAQEEASQVRRDLDAASPETRLNAEMKLWEQIKNSNDPDLFEDFLKKFPDGIYAANAKKLLAKIRLSGMDAPKRAAAIPSEAQPQVRLGAARGLDPVRQGSPRRQSPRPATAPAHQTKLPTDLPLPPRPGTITPVSVPLTPDWRLFVWALLSSLGAAAVLTRLSQQALARSRSRRNFPAPWRDEK